MRASPWLQGTGGMLAASLRHRARRRGDGGGGSRARPHPYRGGALVRYDEAGPRHWRSSAPAPV